MKVENKVMPNEKQMEEFTSAEVEYILANFRKHLKYDLTRDFEKNKTKK